MNRRGRMKRNVHGNHHVSPAEQDYLEAIYELIESKGYTKAVEIAQRLGLKGPSGTRMIQKLSRNGFLTYEKYRRITLTRTGRAAASEMQRRHRLIRELLVGLGDDSRTADADAARM